MEKNSARFAAVFTGSRSRPAILGMEPAPFLNINRTARLHFSPPFPVPLLARLARGGNAITRLERRATGEHRFIWRFPFSTSAILYLRFLPDLRRNPVSPRCSQIAQRASFDPSKSNRLKFERNCRVVCFQTS